MGLLVSAAALQPIVAGPLRAQPGQPESTPATTAAPQSPELTEKEKALLQKINALKAPRWRSFGACRYDWSNWKLMPGDVRTTSVECGSEATPAAQEAVAVHCDTLKVSTRSGDQAWSGWRLPLSATESRARGGEDLMVAALCANAKPIPRSQPASPAAPTGQR